MHIKGFCCLRTDGLYLTDTWIKLLFGLASTMAHKQERRSRFHLPDMASGEVTTQFRTGALGHISGIIFEGKLEIGTRTFNVHYIVEEHLLRPSPDEIADVAVSMAEPDPLDLN